MTGRLQRNVALKLVCHTDQSLTSKALGLNIVSMLNLNVTETFTLKE